MPVSLMPLQNLTLTRIPSDFLRTEVILQTTWIFVIQEYGKLMEKEKNWGEEGIQDLTWLQLLPLPQHSAYPPLVI